MSCIDIHLRKNIEKLRFLELPKEYFSDCDDFIYDNEIQVPIFTDYLEEMILKKKEGISIGEALKSMGYVMGIDKDFKYNNLYFKIIQKYISNPTAFFSSYANTEYNKGEYRNAIIILSCIIHFYSTELDVLFNYANLCKGMIDRTNNPEEKENFYYESKRVFKLIVKHNPRFAMAQYQLGFFFLNDNCLEDAKNSFEIAKKYISEDNMDILEDIDIQINNIKNINSLSIIEKLIEEGNIDLAIRDLYKFHPFRNEEKYKRFFLLGYGYRIKGEYKKAIEHYSHAFDLCNTEVELISELALCFAMMNDFEQAEELYLAALDLSPDSAVLLCNLSMVYMNMNELGLSEKYIKQALDLDDKDEIALSVWRALKKLI